MPRDRPRARCTRKASHGAWAERLAPSHLAHESLGAASGMPCAPAPPSSTRAGTVIRAKPPRSANRNASARRAAGVAGQHGRQIAPDARPVHSGDAAAAQPGPSDCRLRRRPAQRARRSRLPPRSARPPAGRTARGAGARSCAPKKTPPGGPALGGASWPRKVTRPPVSWPPANRAAARRQRAPGRFEAERRPVGRGVAAS